MLTKRSFNSGAQTRVTTFWSFMESRMSSGSDAQTCATTSFSIMAPKNACNSGRQTAGEDFSHASAYPYGAGLTFGGRDGRRDSARAGAGRECAHGERDGRTGAYGRRRSGDENHRRAGHDRGAGSRSAQATSRNGEEGAWRTDGSTRGRQFHRRHGGGVAFAPRRPADEDRPGP